MRRHSPEEARSLIWDWCTFRSFRKEPTPEGELQAFVGFGPDYPDLLRVIGRSTSSVEETHAMMKELGTLLLTKLGQKNLDVYINGEALAITKGDPQRPPDVQLH